ncbi:MAG: VTT domain-containing protein [Ectothiorhodospiraceae bacterium]|jgi:uncharacterized membrane protein YdjX (TVP38/TMEM64 family)/rhodanese-related sulfurtransferase|nr:VTT domain-containing protein [Ectothiorhodospiraceae bacterium]
MRSKFIRIVLALLVIAGIALVVLYREQFSPEAMQQWVDGFGMAGPLVFMLLYAVGTVLFFPGSLLTLAGGALFGPVLGTFYNLTGATLGATLAFLVARYLAADWAERHSGGRLGRLKRGVEDEGWRFVAFVRLVPLFPFNALNYALGLTRIRLWHYVLTSYVCMLPGALAYTYLGYAGREAMAGGEGLIQKGLLALALLAVAMFLPRLIGRLRQKPMLAIEELKRRLDAGEPIVVLDVRPAADFSGEQGHIVGAVNIPLEDLPARLGELAPHECDTLVLVCRTDRRSSQAARLLAEQGFADVHVAKMGMTDWNRLGYPVLR